VRGCLGRPGIARVGARLDRASRRGRSLWLEARVITVRNVLNLRAKRKALEAAGNSLLTSVQRAAREDGVARMVLKLPSLVVQHSRGLGEIERYYEREEKVSFDAEYGTDTTDLAEMGQLSFDESGASRERVDQAFQYMATSAGALRHILRRLPVSRDFVFIDLGSGKGRMVMVASEFPFKKTVGVEFASELHQVAERNLEKFLTFHPERKVRLEIHCMDAVDYAAHLPEDNLVIFLFNPFRPPVMEKVLANLERSVASHPRKVFVVYGGSEVCLDVFHGQRFLEKVESYARVSVFQTKA
jgi:histone methylation protein DOT1